MSQTDLNVANASGAAVRTDINAHLDALASQSSGASEPSTKFPNQWWLDTSTNILKQRDNANTAWVNVASKAGTNWIPYRNVITLDAPSQAEAEAGTATTERVFTAERVAQAIAALASAKILQSISKVIAAQSGTTAIPDDDTTPTNSEGTEIWTQAITMDSASNEVRISGVFNTSNSGSGEAVMAVF